MANASIGGLVSGLDTATIISQLIELESRPQTVLKTRMVAEQKVLTALQAINAKLAGIATKAGDLTKLDSWAPTSVTSNNDKVNVRADPGVAPSKLSFTVKTLAASFQARYTTTSATASAPGIMPAATKYTVAFDDGRASFDFFSGDGSLKAIAAALNATGSGVDAALVPVPAANGTLTYALSVQDELTGAASGFKVTPASDPADTTSFLGGVAAPTAGMDATIEFTGQAVPLHSPTNTFTDLMPGVDVTLLDGSANTVATVTVARDPKTMTDSVKSMVDAMNAVLADIDTQTAFDPATKKSGPLGGDPLLRGLRDQLLSAVTKGVGSSSFADVGIQVNRYGKLTFDEAKFQAAYAADSTAVSAKFIDGTPPGLASTLASITKGASNSTDGTIMLSIKGRTSTIDRMSDDIDGWDVRLAQRKSSLERQYGALEVALGKLQSQSTWLAGQISSLPKTGA